MPTADSGDTRTVPEDFAGAGDGPAGRRRWPRLNRTGAWVLSVCGALLAGAALTQLLMPASVTSERVAPAVGATLEPVAAGTGELVMPNVVGLDVETAQRVLLDTDITAAVTTTSRPAAGPEGVVVAHTPTSGQDVPGDVELVVSVPATVPEVTGGALAHVRAVLEELGAVVQVNRQVDPTQPEGTVLGVEPAPGQPVPGVVKVSVADPGEALTLASVDPAESSSCWTRNSVNVNGAPMQDSVRCEPNGADVSYADWVLARQAVAFEATIGAADDEEPGTAQLRVLGDGRVLLDTSVTYGASAPVRLDVREVLRLRVEVTYPDRDNAPVVVLGDARVLGTADRLAAIEDAP